MAQAKAEQDRDPRYHTYYGTFFLGQQPRVSIVSPSRGAPQALASSPSLDASMSDSNLVNSAMQWGKAKMGVVSDYFVYQTIPAESPKL